jgi:hypothetical protein
VLEAPHPDDVPLPGLGPAGAPCPDAPPPEARLPGRSRRGAPWPSAGLADTVAAHHAKGGRRPADTIWRANPREQGSIGFSDAVAYFGGLGWSVSVPLIDSQPYDLVVDDGRQLQRVQVKTTTYRTRYGVYCVQLCTNGGNQSFQTVKRFDPAACDLLYVLTDARERYLIPVREITSTTTLNLGAKVAHHRVRPPLR